MMARSMVAMTTILRCLLLPLIVSSVWSQMHACEDGWFGSSCQYKCRCSQETKCGDDGQCFNGGCQGGWFGPGCQYEDLAYKSNSKFRDGKDETCIISSPVANAAIKFTLERAIVFTWLRVRVNNSESLQNLTIRFGQNLNVDCLRNASVDDKTLDMFCDQNVLVDSITLIGDAVLSLCSFYVSGGRNVAIRQPTAQSSTYREYFISNRSVDGDTSASFLGSTSCSCTNEYQQQIPNWNVTFQQPQRVTRYVLYNHNGNSNYRMIRFDLQSFDATRTLVFNYTDPNPSSQLVYYINSLMNITSSISLVNVIAHNKDNILQMCEVQVFGDSVCDPRKYGRTCQHDCNCEGGGSCFVSTGGCPSGCRAGFYGEDCQLSCRQGTYGLRCANKCSEFCAQNTSNGRSCDHISGKCRFGCLDGYTGDQCNRSCPANTYGPNCSYNCQFCYNNGSNDRSCSHVNGSCLNGCQSGYDGDLCSKTCPNGTYGQQCSGKCNHFCTTSKNDESPCHHITGLCLFGCTGGSDALFCKQEKESDPMEKVIIAAVVGSVLGVILVALVIFVLVLFIRRRKKGKSSNGNLSRANNFVNRDGLLGSESSVSSFSLNNTKDTLTESNNENNNISKNNTLDLVTKAQTGQYYNMVKTNNSTLISLNELDNFIATKNKDFFKDQFSTIPENPKATMEVSMNIENKLKNRYKNICAYDHSRVHLLSTTSTNNGDYINASYIQGYKSDEKFIASQGPSKFMVEDFLAMLWEQQVEKVVMLTNLVEEGKMKCEKYWPDDEDIRIGDVIIQLSTTQVFADYTIRRLRLKKEGHPSQNLTHFHFTSWPDKDVPNTPWGLVDFEQRVASYPSNKPIVVHCSAGVGRTGTFIAVRNVIRQAKETGQMDFFTTVQKLRQDRINMVQTLNQYIFLHKAAQVAMLCIGTTFTLKDVYKRIKDLNTKMASGQTKMEHEFKFICAACDAKLDEWATDENSGTVYENSQGINSSLKNRYKSILPKEMYRVRLYPEKSGSGLGDYINAVEVQSFKKQNQQILTQLPLPETVTDFWRLVTQQQVNLIVAFDMDKQATDQTISDYLSPTDELTSSLFTIKSEPASSAKEWRQQKLVVFLKTPKEKLNKQTDYHVTHLTRTSAVLDKWTQMTFIQHVRSLQKSSSDGKILYMCRDGATLSGLACVLSLLLDRMDYDQCLTVPLVVGAIKAVRPEVIPTLEQYKLLYEVLDLYSETFNEYSNLGTSQS